MKYINVESDFKLLESFDCKCEVNLKDSEFTFVYYTKKYSDNKVEVSYKGDECTNCKFTEDNRLIVLFENHNLEPGTLKVKRYFNLNDADFSDKTCDFVIEEELPISLTKGIQPCTEECCYVDVKLPPYYQKGDIGPVGPKGDKGDQGDKGDKGDLTVTGATPHNNLLDNTAFNQFDYEDNLSYWNIRGSAEIEIHGGENGIGNNALLIKSYEDPADNTVNPSTLCINGIGYVLSLYTKAYNNEKRTLLINIPNLHRGLFYVDGQQGKLNNLGYISLEQSTNWEKHYITFTVFRESPIFFAAPSTANDGVLIAQVKLESNPINGLPDLANLMPTPWTLSANDLKGKDIYELLVESNKFEGTRKEFEDDYINSINNVKNATNQAIIEANNAQMTSQHVQQVEREIIQRDSERSDAFDLAQSSRQQAYEDAENIRNSEYRKAESSRNSGFGSAENTRNNIFLQYESTRQNNETLRSNAEEDRKKAESERQASFQSNEESRQNTFNTNESTRQNNESIRQTKEAERETKEAERQRIFETNEAIREENEAKRVDAEILRQEAEGVREATFQTNEAAREAEFDAAIQAAKDNLVVVNDLTTGGADKALSAEMGKRLNDLIVGEGAIGEEVTTQDDFDAENYTSIHDPQRGAIWFEVGDTDFTASLEVLEGSPIKAAMHRTSNPTVWGSYTADTGWITAGNSKTVDNTFGSGNYIRIVVTFNSGNGVPTLDVLKANIKFTLTKRVEIPTGIVGQLETMNGKFAQVEQSLNDIENNVQSIEETLTPPTFFNIATISGMVLNSNDGVASNVDYELIDYIEVTDYNIVVVRGGFWNSNSRQYSTIIELYDQDKTIIQKIIPAELIGLTNAAYAYIFEGEINVSHAAYIRFSNLIDIPSSNTNANFKPIEASVSSEYLRIEPIQVVDKNNNKNQSDINAEFYNTLFGTNENQIEDDVTQEDLTEGNYSSTTNGNGRGFFNIPIYSYDNYSLSLSVASNSTVKAAVTLTSTASYDNAIYDSTWIVAGKTSSVDNNTSLNPTIRFIQLRFTYISNNAGVPTIEEIKQYISFEFRGIILTDLGLVGKVSDLEKMLFPESGYKYQGEKISFRDNAFTSEVIGSLSSGVSSRQGGAVFGDYLFQFHNTLQNIVVYNLKTKNNVQTLTLTPISNHHAGSGGFGNEYYDSADPFPILYISSMYENRVYGYRITGTEGSWTIETVQTITINKEGLYIPNIAIDRENNMVVVFGYTKNSWSDSNNNLSVITSFVLPKLSDGDVTVTEFSDERKIPFIYAEQGSFARLGKLYMSYGNTISKCGMYVIDYVSGIAVSHAPFEPLGTFEPEAFALYGENIIMTDQNGNIYKLSF